MHTVIPPAGTRRSTAREQRAQAFLTFLREAKRRKVYVTVVGYVAAALVMRGVGEVVVTATDAPDVTMRIVSILLLLGFPIVVVLAWLFDITSTGVRRTESLHATAKSPDPALVGAQLPRMPGRARAAVAPAEQPPQGPLDPLRVKRATLGHMRHELRTPINGILGYAEMLLEDEPARVPAVASAWSAPHVRTRDSCYASRTIRGVVRVKYALISDIHANLPALEAVLADVAGRADVDATYHLGDLVGYAPWPDEVVALLRDRGIAGVAGNYDSTTATDYEHCGCRYEDQRQEELAHVSYEWTRARVSAATKRHLAGLPFRIDIRPLGGHTAGPRLVLVHGNPVLNTVYWTEDRTDRFCTQMAESVSAKAGDVIAFGHTHRPWTRILDGVHFVNTGSVGRPKDRDPRACYALVTLPSESGAVEFVRVPYDVERAAAAIRESGLPAEFAEHLRTGGAPPDLAPAGTPT